MTITVTPDPTYLPPRCRIVVAAPAGAVMSQVAVYRTDSDGRDLVRSQPSSGFDSRTIYDYEMPYGQPLLYDWTATYNDPSQIVPLWAETWASLAAWTTTGASWAVAGGKLTWTGADSTTANVTRALAAGLYRFIIGAIPVGISSIEFGGFGIDVAARRLRSGATAQTFDPGNGAWTIDMTSSAVTITTTAGTWQINVNTTANQVTFLGPVATIATAPTRITLPQGNGAGQFNPAYSFVIDPVSGNYLIYDSAQTTNRRIHVYTPAGVYVSTFGGQGTGNGQFTAFRGMAIDASRNLFIGDANRIQKFVWNAGTSNYVYSAQVGAAGTGNGQFSSLADVAVDSAGAVYAIDSTARVQKFTNALVYSSQWGTAGTADGQLTGPTLITVAANGSVYIRDVPDPYSSIGRLQKFTNAGVWVRTYPAGTNEGQVIFAMYSMTTLDNVLYIITSPSTSVQYNQMRLSKFADDGTYLGKIDNIGPGGDMGQNSLVVRTNPAGSIVIYDGGAGSMGADLSQPSTGYRISVWTQTKASISAISARTYGSTVTVSETSAAVVVAAQQAYLIHPGNPALSVPVSYDDLDSTTFDTLGDVNLAATSTRHRIMGEDKVITVTDGPRAAPVFSLRLEVEEAAQVTAVRNLVRDQTAILIRIPPEWGMFVDEGFYAVGDVSIARALQEYGQTARLITLPLEASQSPITAVQNSGWSWAQLAADFPTWAAVRAAFATWADVLINNRRPGF